MLRVALVGKTGNGKSSLGNLLLNREAFQAQASFSSQTAEQESATGEVDGRQVTIVDTPGTMDTKDPMGPLKELSRMILESPEGFHAFLIVIRCNVRYTSEENEAVEALRKLFGDRFLDFSIVVFTHGDAVDNDENQLRQELSQASDELKNLLQLCGGRMALVENDRRLVSEQVRKQQIQRLVTQVDELARKNGGLYTDRIFEVAQQEEKQRRQREEERQEAERAAVMDLERRLQGVERQNERYERELQQLRQKYQQERDEEEKESVANILNAIFSAIGNVAAQAVASKCTIQ